MESEPARVPGLAANECAPHGVRFDFSTLLNGWLADREGTPLEAGGQGASPELVRLQRHPQWIVKLPRSSRRLEPGRAPRGWGAGPPRFRVGCAIRLATEPGLNLREPHRPYTFDSCRILARSQWLVAHLVRALI
jgi:hypothetical protein